MSNKEISGMPECCINALKDIDSKARLIDWAKKAVKTGGYLPIGPNARAKFFLKMFRTTSTDWNLMARALMSIEVMKIYTLQNIALREYLRHFKDRDKYYSFWINMYKTFQNVNDQLNK